MLQRWIGRLACLIGRHQWAPGTHYHYILNDSGIHFHECGRCGKGRSS